MDIFANVNDRDVKLSVTYKRGHYVYLHAVYVVRNDFGYEYNPLAGKSIILTPMRRENKKTIAALVAAAEKNKDEIAKLYAENRLNEAQKYF